MADPRPNSPTNWRFDPFTEAYNAVAITDEDREIPGASPYTIRLYEVPRENDPWSITCVILIELDEDLTAIETDVDILAAHYARVIVGDIILVDAEQMEVTGKPGSPELTVNRGYGGTGPAIHTDGAIMEILASMTQVGSGSPATREYRVDYKYSTGLVLFNAAEKGYDVRFDYYGLGSPLSILWTLGTDHVFTQDLEPECVTTAKVKMTWGSYSAAVNAGIWGSAFPFNIRSHLPQLKSSIADHEIYFQVRVGNTVAYLYRAKMYNDAAGARTLYCQWEYHSASPPQEVWIEYDRDTEEIIQVWKSNFEEHMGDVPIEKSRENGLIKKLTHTEIKEIMEQSKDWKDRNYTDDLRAGDLFDHKDLKKGLKAKAKIGEIPG